MGVPVSGVPAVALHWGYYCCSASSVTVMRIVAASVSSAVLARGCGLSMRSRVERIPMVWAEHRKVVSGAV